MRVLRARAAALFSLKPEVRPAADAAQELVAEGPARDQDRDAARARDHESIEARRAPELVARGGVRVERLELVG